MAQLSTNLSLSRSLVLKAIALCHASESPAVPVEASHPLYFEDTDLCPWPSLNKCILLIHNVYTVSIDFASEVAPVFYFRKILERDGCRGQPFPTHPTLPSLCEILRLGKGWRSMGSTSKLIELVHGFMVTCVTRHAQPVVVCFVCHSKRVVLCVRRVPVKVLQLNSQFVVGPICQSVDVVQPEPELAAHVTEAFFVVGPVSEEVDGAVESFLEDSPAASVGEILS